MEFSVVPSFVLLFILYERCRGEKIQKASRMNKGFIPPVSHIKKRENFRKEIEIASLPIMKGQKLTRKKLDSRFYLQGVRLFESGKERYL